MRRTLLLLLLSGCAAPLPTPGEYDAHPESPAILRDVALIDDDVEFTQPFVPGHRTTMDGRVGIRVQGGPPGGDRLAQNLSFFLFAPEKLAEPILPGPPGAQILADPAPFDVLFPPAIAPGTTRLGHHAICDPTEAFEVPGEQPNPYVCGPEGAHDCYDLVVISSTSDDLTTQMWGTPATIEVGSPKTPEAWIVDVTLGEPVAGTVIGATAEFTEPAVTRDGRLLTGRVGRFPRRWTHPDTGVEFYRPYDLMYAVLPEDAAPCDVTGWTDLHPMSHAPYDPAMAGYGLAAYPFRDSEGQPIADGEDLGGTYPWVDREGANVFMTGVHGRIGEQSETRYPRRCVQEGCEELSENVDWDRGFLVGGLWTHGKFVHLDGMINNIDWAVGVTPWSHWMVDLYRDEGEAVPVRFGSGRFIPAGRNSGGPYPDGYTHNANVLDSLQNLMNAHPAAQPVTPRDVVWVMGTGVATDEIAFDDLLDPNALIVSNMQASVTQLYDDDGDSLAIPKHHNGQVRILEGVILAAANYELQPGDDEEIHLQNGATSLRWNVPAYGHVDSGTARVEPVALGGKYGRGFWLSGTNEVRYAVPEQPRSVHEVPWYVGIYVDPRYADDEVHRLLTFPDGSGVRLWGRERVEVTLDGDPVFDAELPAGEGLLHLGFRLEPGGQAVTVLVDGFAVQRYEGRRAVLQPVAGDLVIGEAGEVAWGFRGWIDDFVVLAHDPGVEVACNHAGGTLVRLGDAANDPIGAHAEVAAAAGDAAGSTYACWTDHSADYAAHKANLPAGAVGVREAITFPEGPLRYGQPRPDSSGNAFCLSCHTTEGLGGLGLGALDFTAGLNAEDDRRRQPSQPPRRVFGNIPAGWIPPGHGAGSPAAATVAPAGGALIDAWVLPTE